MANTLLSAEAGTAQVDEPVFNVSNIQGNIIPGFNKDFQALLFLKIEDGKEQNFRRWLEALAPRVTTMEQVLAFRSLLTEDERRGKPPKVKTTWINIAFSHAALGKLGAIKDVPFKDEAFAEGLTKERSKERLGDPEGKDNKGNPKNWVVGGPGNEADMILIIASDDRLDLFNEVARIGSSIYEPPKTNEGRSDQSGVKVTFMEYGANLPGRREHFGFRDGISQPGVRGQISNNFGGYLTPRYEDESQGNPGLDLVWPGEFVFGTKYPKQHLNDATKEGLPSLNEKDMAAPGWAEDGSFLVFRRLRQDVEAFHEFLRDTASGLNKMDPNLLGAKCVGRWASGAPILRASEQDDAKWAQNDSKNNDFTFKEEDPEGKVCPFASHIRKVYPRDDVNESEIQTHRLLRRGIPYGEPSLSSPTAPFSDTVDRGLLFLAYQTSIVNQFEFLHQQANKPEFKGDKVGHDPIIGQNRLDDRKRSFRVTVKGRKKWVSIEKEWVTPTGGGYFFAPSIKTLQMLVETSQDIREAYFSGRLDRVREILANCGGVPQPKAITPETWARIWAHAWLEEKNNKPEFKNMLRKNPATAVQEFKQKAESSAKFPSLDNYNKFFNLEGDTYKKPFDRGAFEGISFSGMSPNDLKEIAEKGTLHGKPFCVQPSEWVIVRRKRN